MIIAEIYGIDRASALGIEVHAPAPVLALCRKLVAAGHDPAEPLEAYRGNILCLKVRTIGEGARLVINAKGTGFRFEGVSAVDRAPLVRFAASADPDISPTQGASCAALNEVSPA
jgi:hypothetical protein